MMELEQLKALNRRWQHEHSEAQERFRFRDAAIASLKKHLAAEAKVEAARKRPLSQQDRTNLGAAAREVHRNDRELKRIEKVMRTDLGRYYEDKLDVRYRELMAH